MAASTELKIVLSVVDQASSAFAKTSASIEAMSKTALVMGGVITGAIALTVKAAADAQAKMANLHATLQAMGSDTPAVSDAILKAADAAVKLGFDNEDAALSITKFYQRTKDMARAKNIDLATATNLVNMALSGSGKALLAYGIHIKDAATPLEALGELQDAVKGQSAAFSQTFEGQMQILTSESQQFMQTIGAQLLPVLTQLFAILTPILQKIMDWVTEHPKMTQVIVLSVAALGALLTVIGTIGLAIPALSAGFAVLAGPIGIAIGLITALGLVFYNVYQITTLLETSLPEILAGISAYWKEFITWLETKIIDPIEDFFAGMWNAIANGAQTAMTTVMAYIQPILDAVSRVASGISSVVSSVGGGVKSAYNAVSSFVTGKAVGGSVNAGQSYLVGENGPELFTPFSSGGITANGGGGVTINITGTFMSQDAAKQMGDMIITQFKRIAKI
jgi:hypothetical protein